jgi:S-adenosylmethionine hydrolase
MQEPPPIITILTDFGEADAFVGTMKGVLLSIAPQAQLVDLSHLIRPQDIKQAAFVLMTAAPYFPDGTVHLVVVDPGVGSARRPVAVETPRARFVAPDNGVLSYALALADSHTAVELANPAYRLSEVSSTFHGRDIFSPAAAHLAAGVPLNELGPTVESLVMLDSPRLIVGDDRVEAEVLNVDHFGNIRTSILILNWDDANTLSLRPIFARAPDGAPAARFSAAQAQVSVGPLNIDGISVTFSSVQPGQPVAFVGSEGGLEIAINQGDAAREFGVKPGDAVALRFGT